MKKIIKNVLIILILLFIIVLGLIIFMFNSKKETNMENIINNNYYYFDEKEKNILNNNFYDISYENDFFKIEEFIDSYYEECKSNNTDFVLNVLDKNYINEKDINKNNIFEIINYEEKYNNFFAKKIYKKYTISNEEEQWNTYYIKGILWSDNYKSKKENYMIINENIDEDKLYIYPQENEISFEDIIYNKQLEFLKNYKEDEKEIEEDDEEQYVDSQEPEGEPEAEDDYGEEYYTNDQEPEGELEAEDDYDEEYNIFDENYYQVTDEDIARRLYEEFKILMLYDNEESYNLITEELKNKEFNTINNYKKYIEINKEKLLSSKIKKYKRKYNYFNEKQFDIIYSTIDSNNFYFNFYIDCDKNIKFDFREL